MSVTINVYLKGGIEHEYTTGDSGDPFTDTPPGLLLVCEGNTVTGYPVGSVLWWNVERIEGEG